MANPTIAQIKVGNTTYDLCDQKVQDTISLVNSNYTNIWDENGSALGWGDKRLKFKDAEGTDISYVSPYNYKTSASGKLNELAFQVANNNNSFHNFVIGINASGEAEVRGTTGLQTAWKTWMGVNGLGTLTTVDVSSNVSIPTSTYKTLASLTVTKGSKWFITGGIAYSGNATGRRYAWICTSNNAAPTNAYRRATAVNKDATSTFVTYLHTSHLAVNNVDGTFYLLGWQNSGSTLNMTGYLRAVRII